MFLCSYWLRSLLQISYKNFPTESNAGGFNIHVEGEESLRQTEPEEGEENRGSKGARGGGEGGEGREDRVARRDEEARRFLILFLRI